MRRLLSLLAVGAAIGTAQIAVARDRNAYAAIKQGDYRTAEQTLVAERRIFPDRPALMLNLAAVYDRTGRATEARALYQAVLDRPNVLMDISADRTAWSHALAQTGLRRGSSVQMSSR